MKTIILTLISLCFTLMLQAQVSKTIQVTAGNLYIVLTDEELATVTNLTLTGTMNARDFQTMRYFMPLLAELDLNDVKLVDDVGLNEAIPSYAFGSNDHLKSIKLPLSCDIIRDHAFSGCSALASLIIPHSVAIIESYAFSGCTGLKSITYLSNITDLGSLGNCPNLSSIYLLGNNPFPNDFLFDAVDKSKCTLYYAPNFYYDYKFKKVIELPRNDVSPNEVFLSATKDITSTIDVSADSTWIVSSDKSWLTVNPTSGRGKQKITITADVNPLETGRTAQLTFKTDTVVVNSVVVSQAGKTRLMNVSAGDFSNLEYDEFQLLSSIRLTGTIDKSDMDVMKRMLWLSEIDMREVDILAYNDGFQIFPENTIPERQFWIYSDNYHYSYQRKLKSILLPYSCDSIGNSAFSSNVGLTSLTIPSSIPSIGNGTFRICTGLKSIFAHSNSPVGLISDGDVFYNVDKEKCTLFVPYGSKASYARAYQWQDFKNIVEIPFVEVFKTQLNVSASWGSTAPIKIVSDVNWTASSDQTWLTLSQNTGSGESLLIFYADANPGTMPRTATVTVSADGVEKQTITITQEGGPTALPDLVENSTQLKCYPNPFTDQIIIEIQNPKRAEITVDIYNLAGEWIRNLATKRKDELLDLKWNGDNDSGLKVAPGVYICKMNNWSKQIMFQEKIK